MRYTLHPHIITIPPVPAGNARPRWSVMIPTHNCAHYLRTTLLSVLDQDPGPEQMQIEVVDDHSTVDDPEAVVNEVGQGRVCFYRQPRNVGHVRNFETCLLRARGELVHLLHGDDCVRPGFYRALEHAFTAHPEIGAAFCRFIVMDEHGHWRKIGPLEQFSSGIVPDWLDRIAVGQRLQTPAMVVRRAVYEHLGGFDRRLRWTEDWEMWVRIAAHYPVWYEAEPLAIYRVHTESNSSALLRTAESIRDVRKAIGIMQTYLPPERAALLARDAHAICARTALRRARRYLSGGDQKASLTHMVEAVKSYPSPTVVIRTFGLFALWLRAHLQHAKRQQSTP